LLVIAGVIVAWDQLANRSAYGTFAEHTIVRLGHDSLIGLDKPRRVGVEIGERWRPDRRNACRQGLARGFGAQWIEIVEQRTVHEKGIGNVGEWATGPHVPRAIVLGPDAGELDTALR
jgi:hypothetical protein